MEETDTEAESVATPPARTASPSSDDQFTYRIKGNAIVSDDDDDDNFKSVPKLRQKGKSRALINADLDDIPSRSERSLRTMMDIDDGMLFI